MGLNGHKGSDTNGTVHAETLIILPRALVLAGQIQSSRLKTPQRKNIVGHLGVPALGNGSIA